MTRSFLLSSQSSSQKWDSVDDDIRICKLLGISEGADPTHVTSMGREGGGDSGQDVK